MIPRPRRVTTPLFTETLSRGAITRNGLLTIRLLPIEGKSKVSVVVPKKVAASAVARNALRRRYVGAVENILPRLVPGFSIIFFVQKPVSRKEFLDETLSALKKSKMLSAA